MVLWFHGLKQVQGKMRKAYTFYKPGFDQYVPKPKDKSCIAHFHFYGTKILSFSSASVEHRDNLDKNLIGHKILTIRSLPKGG